MNIEQTNDKNTVLSVIKIGRKEYSIKKGDYILYNGNSYLFCSGDNRILKREKWYSYSNLRLPNSIVKKIPFDSMLKQNFNSFGVDLVKWLF